MNTNQIPELLSYEEALGCLAGEGVEWGARRILLGNPREYLQNPRWPRDGMERLRPILESYVRYQEAEKAAKNAEPCPERVPCPHTIGEHRGVNGTLGCSVEGCPCNVQYVFALNGKDEIRFRADFTGTDKIAGEERWQASPLSVQFAGALQVFRFQLNEESKTSIEVDASRFFKLAAAFVDHVRAGAEQRRLADVRAIRNREDAKTWLKTVSLAHAVEGILALKADTYMASQLIDNPEAVQNATRAKTPPSGLSAIMHDAYTHPRRHDPISLGEELDGPELDTFAAETVTAMDQLEKERGEK